MFVHGAVQLFVVVAFALVVREVLLELLFDLIEVNCVDQIVICYETFDDLLGYCWFLVVLVGCIVLHLVGVVIVCNVVDFDVICVGL